MNPAAQAPHLPKDLRPAGRRAEQQGWRFLQGKGHVTWLAPDGIGRVVTNCTPGGGRGVANSLAALKRAGLK